MSTVSATVRMTMVTRSLGTAVVKPHVPMIKFRKGGIQTASAPPPADPAPAAASASGGSEVGYPCPYLFQITAQVPQCTSGGRYPASSGDLSLTSQSAMSSTWEAGTSFGDTVREE